MENFCYYRYIKSVDEYIKLYINKYGIKYSMDDIKKQIRNHVDFIKDKIKKNEINLDILQVEYILSEVENKLKINESKSTIKPVINATGVVLHTNLGRSILNKSISEKIIDIATNYVDIEMDTSTGLRSQRGVQIVELLKSITNTEDALIVNNNAAAVLLILSTLAKDKEVIISRGELVEIGGSFRIPDVMLSSGAILHEIGTTNKTRLSDYENAINEDTVAIMKVHTSNFKISGFTENVDIEALAALSNKYDIPLIHDLGSGTFVNLFDEPTIRESMKYNCDLVCFSGDKLLGACQAGIILGKKVYIDKLRKNPLMRALRVDKITMVTLLETLKLYKNTDKAVSEIPTLKMLHLTDAELLNKAKTLSKIFKDKGIENRIMKDFSSCGGGALPSEKLATYTVCVKSNKLSNSCLLSKLRNSSTPIIARISDEGVLFDIRTISDNHYEYISNTLKDIFNHE